MAERTKETEFASGKDVPEKYCEGCGERMHPKRWSNGRLETPAMFERRKTHDVECRRKAESPIPETEKHLRNIGALYAEQGLSTYEIAELYGCHSASIHSRLVRRGVEIRSVGENHPNRINKSLSSHGYVKIGDRYEHRMLAEETLGRPLREGEVVHHKNGDRTDNRPENLEVLSSQSEHMELHRQDNSRWSPEADAVLVWCRGHGFSAARIAGLLNTTHYAVRNRAALLVDRGRATPIKPGRKPGGPPPVPAWLQSLAQDMESLGHW